MSTEKKPETTVGGLDMSQLREMMVKAPDEILAGFITSYALGFGADQFIAAMTRPNERVGFLLGVAQTYADDWQRAIEALAKAGK